ncbi:hypothetical protein [Reichenbachiella versicolor]|uniref:hypothetical protein n=1 Tax=Reichenbachiella versicolor TaxID=1821036 RepID=UPI000D6E8272|nr:hypothetical protein [Reichenbachiella versicolor]
MRRNYNLSDDELVQYGYTVLEHLNSDLPDFTSMDADLNEDKRSDLAAKIEVALRDGGDEANKSEIGQKTETLLSEMSNARKLYNQLRYWVLKTYPRSKAIQRQFGIGRFTKVSRNQTSLIGFFYELSETVKQYMTELTAAGATEAFLNEVIAQADKMKNAEVQQEVVKGNRTVSTAERIGRLNEIYDILREFNAAAEFTYFAQPEKREFYRTPAGTPSVEEEESLEA